MNTFKISHTQNEKGTRELMCVIYLYVYHVSEKRKRGLIHKKLKYIIKSNELAASFSPSNFCFEKPLLLFKFG